MRLSSLFSAAGAFGGRPRRRITTSVAVASAVGALVALAPGTGQAGQAVRPALSPEEPCAIHSQPSFVAQGKGNAARTLAEVLEVACEPLYAGQKVSIGSNELYSRCAKRLSWTIPYPYSRVTGREVKLKLGDNGAATVVVWGGPDCASGESQIFAALEAFPFTTVVASFTLLPPQETSPGVTALPSSEPASAPHASVATVIEIEFPSVYADRPVAITAPSLYRRCQGEPHVVWLGQTQNTIGTNKESVLKVLLDNNGNAFVVVDAGPDCAPGESVILVTLEEAPYTQYTTSFTILPPETT